MSAKKQQRDMAIHYAEYCDLVFSQETISADDMIEIHTLCAIAIELIKTAPPSVVREAGRTVEIRSYKDRMK